MQINFAHFDCLWTLLLSVRNLLEILSFVSLSIFQINIASSPISWRSVKNWTNRSCCSFFIYLQISQNKLHFFSLITVGCPFVQSCLTNLKEYVNYSNFLGPIVLLIATIICEFTRIESNMQEKALPVYRLNFVFTENITRRWPIMIVLSFLR